jgi:hypothetical protein
LARRVGMDCPRALRLLVQTRSGTCGPDPARTSRRSRRLHPTRGDRDHRAVGSDAVGFGLYCTRRALPIAER